MRALSVIIFSLLSKLVAAETHTWYFETTWVTANPDGVFTRPVIGLNNTWPLPTLRVKTGDVVNLYLTNGFTNANTSLHFHGMFQNGTTQMDGAEGVTQCPIAPGDTMLYNFTVADQVGTYWYHSHTLGQYGDGMRGLFIIEEKEKSDYPFEFAEDVTLKIGDWYHHTAAELHPKFMSRFNPTGAEPVPKNSLFNDTRNAFWHVAPNTTYYLRICNVGGFASQYLYMEDHEFTVVEVDGIYVKPNTTSMLYITAAQRYGVLVTTKNDTSKNYAFMSKFDDGMFDVIPDDLMLNSTNTILYDESNGAASEYIVDELDYLDDFYLQPYNNVTILDDADHSITIDVSMDNLGNGVNYAFFNNITYTTPKVPIIGTALSAGEFATNSYIYGNTHSIVLQKDDVIDIILNNHDSGRHPFHLHGHVFQLIARGEEAEEIVNFDPSDVTFPEHPMVRDVVYVNPQSYIVMRFKADNPGVWLFHCHIEWHLEQGLAIVLIEAPQEMQKQESQQLTENFKQVCKNSGVKFTGNAAGNDVNFMDLTGANVQQPPLPAGFTARGIVALVFSSIAGILGMVAISLYGMADIKDIDKRVMREMDVEVSSFDEDESAVVCSTSSPAK
ncbi:hypothetical protein METBISCDRAFT_23146 [Metschnikowia bicuspidata]|uniref:Iron transport multicopper oxidase FET3 n=1 Tax=Metschnikowia bicuspidata TaxID=27322 RepID=A0A4P9ZCQ6_9ASCO|nr:hypothetical protein METBISCDRAFT_23146 [Metschnikowia bicuspidata]